MLFAILPSQNHQKCQLSLYFGVAPVSHDKCCISIGSFVDRHPKLEPDTPDRKFPKAFGFTSHIS